MLQFTSPEGENEIQSLRKVNIINIIDFDLLVYEIVSVLKERK